MAFREFSLNGFKTNPFTLFPSLCVVTAGDRERNNPMLIGWGSLGYVWRRPVASIYIRESRFTRPLLDEKDYFTMSFLPDEFRKEETWMGMNSGRDGDKFTGSGLHPVFIDGHACGVEEADIILVCRRVLKVPLRKENYTDRKMYEQWYPGIADENDHILYMGEVVKALAKE